MKKKEKRSGGKKEKKEKHGKYLHFPNDSLIEGFKTSAVGQEK